MTLVEPVRSNASGTRPLARGLGLLTLFAALAVSGSALAAGSAAPAPDDACPSSPQDRSICGVTNPEDMIALSGSQWVLVSGYASDALYRVSTRTRRAVNLAPLARVRWDKSAYARCPGPLAAGGLTAHGIALSRGRAPKLFVVNHGSREAIEVYRVRRRDAALTWIGCLPVPVDMMANSVAALKSGALVVTSLGRPGTNVLPDIVAGRITGNVRLWVPGKGWSAIPSSEGSGPNGVALAPDERSVFVAMSGSREIVRMTLDGRQPPTRSAKLGILPDNLRWSAEGALLTTGMRYDPEANLRCFSGPDCRPPIGVYKIAPGTLALADLTTRLDLPSMPLATTALQVGNELWISSLGSQRISVVALRP